MRAAAVLFCLLQPSVFPGWEFSKQLPNHPAVFFSRPSWSNAPPPLNCLRVFCGLRVSHFTDTLAVAGFLFLADLLKAGMGPTVKGC